MKMSAKIITDNDAMPVTYGKMSANTKTPVLKKIPKKEKE